MLAVAGSSSSHSEKVALLQKLLATNAATRGMMQHRVDCGIELLVRGVTYSVHDMRLALIGGAGYDEPGQASTASSSVDDAPPLPAPAHDPDDADEPPAMVGATEDDIDASSEGEPCPATPVADEVQPDRIGSGVDVIERTLPASYAGVLKVHFCRMRCVWLLCHLMTREIAELPSTCGEWMLHVNQDGDAAVVEVEDGQGRTLFVDELLQNELLVHNETNELYVKVPNDNDYDYIRFVEYRHAHCCYKFGLSALEGPATDDLLVVVYNVASQGCCTYWAIHDLFQKVGAVRACRSLKRYVAHQIARWIKFSTCANIHGFLKSKPYGIVSMTEATGSESASMYHLASSSAMLWLLARWSSGNAKYGGLKSEWEQRNALLLLKRFLRHFFGNVHLEWGVTLDQRAEVLDFGCIVGDDNIAWVR